MLTSYWKKKYTGVCNDIQHMFVTVPEVNLCLTIFCVSCNCFSFFLFFNWCNAILTDKLTRAKEEGLSIKQILDHTLMEMVNIWPSSVTLLKLPHLLWIWLAPIWLTATRKAGACVCLLWPWHLEDTSSAQVRSSSTVSFTHCSQRSFKVYCTSLIVYMYVWGICTFLGNILHMIVMNEAII